MDLGAGLEAALNVSASTALSRAKVAADVAGGGAYCRRHRAPFALDADLARVIFAYSFNLPFWRSAPLGLLD